jgi:hypothetical protein
MDELFKDFGKVFLRTPIYSYTSLFDDNNATKNLEDLVRLRIGDPVFLEALYWSSPQLFEAVLKFKEMHTIISKALYLLINFYVLTTSGEIRIRHRLGRFRI